MSQGQFLQCQSSARETEGQGDVLAHQSKPTSSEVEWEGHLARSLPRAAPGGGYGEEPRPDPNMRG